MTTDNNLLEEMKKSTSTIVQAVNSQQSVLVQSDKTISQYMSALSAVIDNAVEEMKSAGLKPTMFELPSLYSHIVFSPIPPKDVEVRVFSDEEKRVFEKKRTNEYLDKTNGNVLVVSGHLYNDITSFVEVAKERNIPLVIAMYNTGIDGAPKGMLTDVFSDKEKLAAAFEDAQTYITNKPSLNEEIKHIREKTVCSERFEETLVLSSKVRNKLS